MTSWADQATRRVFRASVAAVVVFAIWFLWLAADTALGPAASLSARSGAVLGALVVCAAAGYVMIPATRWLERRIERQVR